MPRSKRKSSGGGIDLRKDAPTESKPEGGNFGIEANTKWSQRESSRTPFQRLLGIKDDFTASAGISLKDLLKQRVSGGIDLANRSGNIGIKLGSQQRGYGIKLGGEIRLGDNGLPASFKIDIGASVAKLGGSISANSDGNRSLKLEAGIVSIALARGSDGEFAFTRCVELGGLAEACIITSRHGKDPQPISTRPIVPGRQSPLRRKRPVKPIAKIAPKRKKPVQKKPVKPKPKPVKPPKKPVIPKPKRPPTPKPIKPIPAPRPKPIPKPVPPERPTPVPKPVPVPKIPRPNPWPREPTPSPTPTPAPSVSPIKPPLIPKLPPPTNQTTCAVILGRKSRRFLKYTKITDSNIFYGELRIEESTPNASLGSDGYFTGTVTIRKRLSIFNSNPSFNSESDVTTVITIPPRQGDHGTAVAECIILRTTPAGIANYLASQQFVTESYPYDSGFSGINVSEKTFINGGGSCSFPDIDPTIPPLYPPLSLPPKFNPPRLPNQPTKIKPMDCCDLTREIHKHLGIKKLKKNKFPVAKAFLVAGGEGNEECEDYYQITQQLFRMLANGLIINPKSKPLGNEWQSVNATAWAGNMYEMMAETMSDGNSSQKYEIASIMQLTQLLTILAETSRKVEYLIDRLGGGDPIIETEEVPAVFTVYEGHKGFEKKSAKKIDITKAKTDDDVEALLSRMIAPSKIPIEKWTFNPNHISILEAIRGESA